MAEPNQNPKQQNNDQRGGEQRQQTDAQRSAASQQPAAETRVYVAKHRIVRGGKDNRRSVAAGTELRLTDAEAAKLGDAVELKRSRSAESDR